MASEVDRFAEALMREVRDVAIDAAERRATGQVGGLLSDRWREVLATQNAPMAVRDLIPDIVDGVLFQLLDAVDNGRLALAWEDAHGRCVSLREIGGSEMAGWLMGSPDSWRQRFSKQRFTDPLAGLKLED